MWRHGPFEEIASAFMRAPMLRAVLPFILGLLLVYGLDPPMWVAWAYALIATALFFAFTRKAPDYSSRWVGGLAMANGMLALGMLWQGVRQATERPMIPDGASPQAAWLVEVDAVGRSSGMVQRLEVDLLALIDTNALLQPVQGRMLLTVADSTIGPLRNGMRIWVRGVPFAFDRVPDPGAFDQRQWAASKCLHRTMFVRAGHAKVLPSQGHGPGPFERWRMQLVERLDRSGLAPPERALAKALVLGFRDELTPEQRSGFVRSGTMHVLALSGLHVGILYGVLLFLLSFLGERTIQRMLRGALILLGIWGYAFLTGGSPSVLRASVMFSLFAVAGMVGRGRDALNSLSAAAFILLLIDPGMLHQLSFQFSFLAVLGIILFYDPLRRVWEPAYRWLELPWSILCVSIAAQVMTTPLSLLVFKAFPTWFLPANILVVSGIGIIVCGSALVLLLGPVPVVGSMLAWLVGGALHLVSYVTDGIAQWPMAYPAIRISTAQSLLMYALVLFAAAWLIWRVRILLAWSGLVTFILLLSWGRTAHARSTSREFIVHDQRYHLALTYREGRALHTVADTAMTAKQRDALERATGACLDSFQAFGQEDLQYVSGLPWEVLLVQGDIPDPLPPVPFDVLVLNGRWSRSNAATLREQPPLQALVLAPGMSPRDRRQARWWCRENGLACHDIRTQGAFILQD
ncbi:MAG: ComEC/Rec2 family competence protein [Flavobacteriales bacterium]|nr:ComEC/Rec2 family competence protein [Flavobacteriales bacterium]